MLLAGRDGRGARRQPAGRELLGVGQTDLLSGRRPDGWEVCDEFGAPVPRVADISGQVLDAATPATGTFVVTVRGEPYRRLWAEVHPAQTDLLRGKGLIDPLTGLPNRALLFDRLEQALVRARTHGTMVGVVLADLRGLSDINANWEFPYGDRVLAVVSRRLREELRADHTLARYAGGTFAVVADHPHGTAQPIADRIGAIAAHRVILGHGRWPGSGTAEK